MITSDDQTLIDAATALLSERYNPPVHSVAAALRTASGDVISSVNIDHFSGYVCAETAALDHAVSRGLYDIERIVAVRKNDNGDIAVVNMCGKCRQIFHDYAPEVSVIVADDMGIEVKAINELLPFSFARQQQKIQAVIKKDEK
jgi:cytidine deaminase